jgi:GxxExxY protein
MPIQCKIAPVDLSHDEYHALDHQVMGVIFAVHNALGNQCDEGIYQKEIVYRCLEKGLAVKQEAPIQVSWGSFSTTYSMDLVVNDGIVYELKTSESLHARHRQQIMNYMFLSGVAKGKLVNLRPSSVCSEFVNATVTSQERFRYRIESDKWINVDENSSWAKETLAALLADWGAFLDIQLYLDAIGHLRGGDVAFLQPVEIEYQGRRLGTQLMHLLSPAVALRLTAVKEGARDFKLHLLRLLNHTRLAAIQWVNFDRHVISMETLPRSRRR